jgi:hypothetical protein
VVGAVDRISNSWWLIVVGKLCYFVFSGMHVFATKARTGLSPD